ncbi:uncharacterized protein PgNI_07376 [Pyricularia grisea]|uniref:Clr5 domain-containing protein n=1 Tax=Pyricularia grisea TaxID=148305 RepID=A0A6P8B199_PYRGI|nr:uncharacterized protein PgNI_07376 [Pyricularia grisea]TLD08609.1 hypothetical protein PgNI_07376 [Pyricularia grisea]
MPPARTARISDRQWDEVETRIKQLVHQHVPLRCKDGSRDTIPEILQRELNIKITVSQLEAKLKEWNVAKNLRLREWKVIMPWLDELEGNGTEYQLFLAEKEIRKTAIDRARRSLRAKSNDDASLGSAAEIIESREICIKIRENNNWVPFKQTAAPIKINAALDEAATQEEDHDLHTSLLDPSPVVSRSQLATSQFQTSQLALCPASTTQGTRYAAPESGCAPTLDLIQAAHYNPHDQTTIGDNYFSLDPPLLIGPAYPTSEITDLWLNTLSPAPDTFDLWMGVEDMPVVQQSHCTIPSANAAATLTEPTQVSVSLWPTEMPAKSTDLLRLMLQHAADYQENNVEFESYELPSLYGLPSLTLPLALPGVEELLDRLLGLIPRDEVDGTFSRANEETNTGSIIRSALIFSIVNNFAGLSELPKASIVSALKYDSKLRSELFQRLRESSAALAKTVLDNLFRATVEACDAKTAKLIIDTGKGTPYAIRLDEIVCTYKGSDYSPLQLAARLYDHEMTKMLLNLGADPNKIAPWQDKMDLSISPLFLAMPDGSRGNFEAAKNTTLALLEHGAITPIHVIQCILGTSRINAISWEAGYLPPLFRALPAADHRECFGIVSDKINPSQQPIICGLSKGARTPECTAIFRLLIENCIDSGCGRCTVDFAENFEQSLTEAAKSGNLELCELHLQNGVPVTIGMFCAAIRSQNQEVIDLCMRHQFIAITPSANIELDDWMPRIPLITTPLAEAVRTENHLLAKIFEGLGAWSLVESLDDHFVAVLSAAARVGDLGSLGRALHLRASGPGVLLFIPLLEAIKHEQTEAALMLLDEGARLNYSDGGTLLVEALVMRNKRILEAILDSNVDVEVVRYETRRIMEEAGKWGDISIIKDLTSMGFNLNHGEETTVLIEAIKLQNNDLVIFLLSSGANPNVQLEAESSWSPLCEAIRIKNEEMVDLLLLKGANPADKFAFIHATKPGNPCLIKLLNAFRMKYSQGLPGFGPDMLIKTIQENEIHLFALLLSAGFDANSFGSKSATPLGFATQTCPNIEFVVQLLDSGVDISRVAVARSLPWETKKQDRASSDAESLESSLEPAILVAVKAGRDAIVRLLLDRGADVNQPARRGVKRTPLQAACELGNWKMVNLLLQRGANVGAPPTRRGGGTALQMAAKGGYIRIVELLISVGASVHEAPSRVFGRSALEGAAENGRLRMLGVLWTAGQSTSGGFPDEEIIRAIKYASQKGHKGCADYLTWLWATHSAGTRGISEEVHAFDAQV